MGDSQQDQTRQRAREAMLAVYARHHQPAHWSEMHAEAHAAYFDERMRGEPRCQCQWEAGDSPCRVHGEHEAEPSVNGDALSRAVEVLTQERDALRARVAELEAERDEARHALDSIGDMLIAVEGAMSSVVARTITRCIEDAKWRKQPEFSERPASLRKRIAELEAVVRAADLLYDCCGIAGAGGCKLCDGSRSSNRVRDKHGMPHHAECAQLHYDHARTKLEVPHG